MKIAMRDATAASAVSGGEVLSFCTHAGAGAVELEVARDFTLPHVRAADGAPLSLPRDVSAIQRQLPICALLIASDFSADDFADHTRWSVETANLANELGIRVIRLDPLQRNKSLDANIFKTRLLDSLRRIVDETSNVCITIENHGPLANDPEFLDEILRLIPDPRFGLTLDTGNFYWYGFSLNETYAQLERFAPRAHHTHLKNVNYPPADANRRRETGFEYKQRCCSLDEGNLELRRIIATLRNTGYEGDLCIENESLFKYSDLEEKQNHLRRDIAAVRAAMQ